MVKGSWILVLICLWNLSLVDAKKGHVNPPIHGTGHGHGHGHGRGNGLPSTTTAPTIPPTSPAPTSASTPASAPAPTSAPTYPPIATQDLVAWQQFVATLDSNGDGKLSAVEVNAWNARASPAQQLDVNTLSRLSLIEASGLNFVRWDIASHLSTAPVGSCANLCGGFNFDPNSFRWCFCDELCHMFGDCCADKCTACGSSSPLQSNCVNNCPSTFPQPGDGCFPPRVCGYDDVACPGCPSIQIPTTLIECTASSREWWEQTSYSWSRVYTQSCTTDMCSPCWQNETGHLGRCNSITPIDQCDTNLLTDRNHCNGCNRPCPGQDSLCVAGFCQASCAPYTSADCNVDGTCEDLLSDVNNCGACGRMCPGPSATCVDGICENALYTHMTSTLSDLIQQNIDDFLNERNYKDTRRGSTHAKLLRMAFHDAGTRQGPYGGAHGCILRPCLPSQLCEQRNPNNRGMVEVAQMVYELYRRWSNVISQPDFLYFVIVRALYHSSNGYMIIPLRFGRSNCPHYPLPYYGNVLPQPHMNFPQIDAYFSSLGFTNEEWITLLGAHSMGGASPENTNHARNWTDTPWEFSNAFFRNLADESMVWIREPAGPAGSTDPNVPREYQFQIRGKPLHTDLMMLPSDMETGWCLSNNDGDICPGSVVDNCNVTHSTSSDFCPPRAQTLGPLIQAYAADQSLFFDKFKSIFTKLIELTDDHLDAVSN